MSLEYRTLTMPAEVETAFRVFLRAMVGLPFHDLDAADLVEPGRYLGAFDDTELVGGADSYTSWLVVPGGQRVPHAAVTHIGVLPTHRRRGIAHGLVTRQLEDIAARGEIVASLRASEATIYERFGYGVASSATSADVVLARAALRPDVPAGGRVRLLDADATPDLLQAIYRQAAWAGAIDRPAGWWRLRQLIGEQSRVARYAVVHSSNGTDDGYALYEPRDTDTWFTSTRRTVSVTDLVALNDDARAGLWRHLLTLDLVDVVSFAALALDDPLPLALHDPRAVTSGPDHDETWLRLVDVEAALRARAYAEHEPVVVQVVDGQLPTNQDTFQIAPEAVTRTSAAPDVTVDVATLAAAYLGGTRWRQLASVGRLTVHTPQAVRRLDALFAVDALPFAGTVF